MRPLAALLVIAACLTSPALAQDRVALVIGNDRYPNLPADRQLRKAVNDARAVGAQLEKLGFSVIRGENLSRAEMVDKLFAFQKAIKPGATAVMFFAGHGVAFGGGNYLLPSDIPTPRQGEETRARNLSLGEADIIADIQEQKPRVLVMVLDACRDNPFRQPGLTRSIGGETGLTRGREAEGVFTIYSAGFGQAAVDNLGDDDKSPNSIFTRALLPALARTDAHLADAVIDMREEVARLAATVGHQQYPAYYDQTRGGRVYLAGRTATGPVPIHAPAPGPGPAPIKQKVALVIGIGKYQHLPTLKNPANEATQVGVMLRKAGFDSVQIRTDLDREGMLRALSEFRVNAEGTHTAVIYFAGQGVRRGSLRFLLSVDTRPDSIERHGIGMATVQDALPSSARVKFVAIDACQDEVGLSLIPEPDPPSPPTDRAPIFFSSSPLEQAQDGDGDLSPFARAFIKHFQVPGHSIRQAATLVRQEVIGSTKGKQTPVLYGTIPAEVTLLGR